MKRACWTIVALLTAFALGLSLYAADRKGDSKAPKREAAASAAPAPEEADGKPTAYLSAEEAGPAYVVQGEYLGDIGEKGGNKTKLGVQVAALGHGEFLAAFLPGGLPGEGHDGKTRIEVPGKADDPAGGEVTFTREGGKGYSGVVNTPNMRVKTPEGETVVLKKVERVSPTLGAKPPQGATVLFDGTNTDQWANGHVDDRKLLMTGAETKKQFKDFTLHAEFLLPFKPLGRDQDRGNSGIYIQKRYEVQVLDSFGQPPVFNGCGSLYRQKPPAVNMCYPPLRWQTYDIDFQSAKFDGSGKKVKNAVITVKLNGVVVHDNYEITDKTGAGQPEGPTAGPILLQGHGNPVFYRNIWVVEK